MARQTIASLQARIEDVLLVNTERGARVAALLDEKRKVADSLKVEMDKTKALSLTLEQRNQTLRDIRQSIRTVFAVKFTDINLEGGAYINEPKITEEISMLMYLYELCGN